jgi:hypothetical protein
VGIIARQCGGLVDTPFYRHTGGRPPRSQSLSWCRLCHVSAERTLALALGACAVPRYGRYKSRLPRHTHDTLDGQNRAFGDLPDVHRLAARTPPAVKMAVRDCADRASSVANEDYGSCPRSRLETDYEPRAMGSPQPSFTRPNLTQSKYVAAPALLMQLIFLVTDRSRSHGHAP